MLNKWMILGLAATAMTPVAAKADTTSLAYFSERVGDTKVPGQLAGEDRRFYTEYFAAIQNQQWDRAQAMLAERERGPLHDIAKAELYLAAKSPKVEIGPLLALLNDAPDIPQAEQLARLAEKRGATFLPARPAQVKMASFASITRRGKPRSVNDGSIDPKLAEAIQGFIVQDDPGAARDLLFQNLDLLSVQAKTEWQQRVAWSFYIENRDQDALLLARQAASGGAGDWLGEAHWVAGLAGWRLGDCAAAAQGFDGAAQHGSNPELRAAGHYWAARNAQKCRRPDLVQANLRRASDYGEAFYGLLAGEQLGLDRAGDVRATDFGADDWRVLRDRPNVKRAIALTEIGQTLLADEVLRHEARIAGDKAYDALVRIARDLSLPQTQIWLAHNAPRGAKPDNFARFPSPRWAPAKGWRVDPALVFAHALQESNFQTNARSAADARGLMQVLPGSARDMASAYGESFDESDLYRPAANLEYGQRYLEKLRDMAQTQGLLPKVIAAYNAGPTPVGRWNSEIRDGGDPLLFIESIPYYETRAYVGIILRNYWMYERQAGGSSPSAAGLAQGLWPRFPTAGKVELVRLDGKIGD